MDGQGGHCGDVVQAFLKVVCKDNKGNQKKTKILTLNNTFNKYDYRRLRFLPPRPRAEEAWV